MIQQNLICMRREQIRLKSMFSTVGSWNFAESVQHEGYWTGILDNLEKGFHYVTFDVNGTRVVNPDAPVGYGCFQTINYIEVPEKDFEYPLLRDIPHGHVRMDYYTSSQTGRQKLCYVYTPPGYETGDKSYPVLYLQHGGGENADRLAQTG